MADLLDEAIRLAACPFCGGDNVRTNHITVTAPDNFHKVVRECQCIKCGARGPKRDESEADANAAWNTRALPTLAAELQQAREALSLAKICLLVSPGVPKHVMQAVDASLAGGQHGQ